MILYHTQMLLIIKYEKHISGMANGQITMLVAISISLVSIGLLVSVQSSLQSDLRDLNNKLSEQSEQIQSLQSDLKANQEIMNGQKTSIDTLQSEVDKTNVQLLKQNDEIASLTKEIDNMQANIAQMRHTIKLLDDKVTSMEQRVKEQPCVSDDTCPSPLGQTLVGYWKFDEGEGTITTDGSGSRNTGALAGDPTWILDSSCIIGKCLGFDGVDDHVEVQYSSSLNPTDAITIAAWYKPVSFKGNGNNPIVDKGYFSHTAPFYQYHLGVSGDQHPVNPGAFLFSVSTTGTSGAITTPSGFWAPGNWYHVVGTYDGSKIKLYVNGSLIASTPASGSMRDYGKNLHIGGFDNLDYANVSYLAGVLDEIQIYNRSLSPSEIRAIFDAYSTGK